MDFRSLVQNSQNLQNLIPTKFDLIQAIFATVVLSIFEASDLEMGLYIYSINIRALFINIPWLIYSI